MILQELVGQLERQATDAERVHSTAPVSDVLRAVLEDLRDIDDADGTETNGSEPDQLVDIRKAAEMLGVKTRYLYDNEFPFTQRIGRHLRFSLRGLKRYMARRR